MTDPLLDKIKREAVDGAYKASPKEFVHIHNMVIDKNSSWQARYEYTESGARLLVQDIVILWGEGWSLGEK